MVYILLFWICCCLLYAEEFCTVIDFYRKTSRMTLHILPTSSSFVCLDRWRIGWKGINNNYSWLSWAVYRRLFFSSNQLTLVKLLLKYFAIFCNSIVKHFCSSSPRPDWCWATPLWATTWCPGHTFHQLPVRLPTTRQRRAEASLCVNLWPGYPIIITSKEKVLQRR